MKIPRSDGFLKIIVVVFPLIVLGNTLEYFLINKNNLKHVRGKVKEIERKEYRCDGGSLYTTTICEKTIIKLENVRGAFHVADDAGRDAYMTGIEKGDEVDIYVRKWYQFILTFGAARDIYSLEKNGEVFYDIRRWKATNIAFAILFGIFSLFFGALYILQRKTINELFKGKKV